MKNFDEISKTFCVLPWIHLSSTPNGNVKTCCLFKTELKNDNGEIFSFEKNSIKEVWNSDELLKIRSKMLNGEKVSGCEQCYSEESIGDHSMRIGFNEKWYNQEKKAIFQRVEESKENNFKLNSMPWYYDLRQGNLCNLKCRTCAPHNSVSIEKEYIKISENNKWFQENIGSIQLDNSYRNWFNNESFNQQLIEQLPNIKKLYFTGGEPTLIEKNYILLQYCIDQGFAANIELMFNTNLTNLSDKFIEIIKKFRHVLLNLSIEGFGQEQEYIRSNSKWTVIDSNLNKLALNHSQNMQFIITPVVQAYNVLTIDKLFYYIEDLNEKYKKNIFQFMLILLTEPKYLELNLLPQKTKQLAVNRLEDYLTKSKTISHDRYFKKRIQQVINKLKEDFEENLDLTEKFIYFTKSLDQARNQNFKEVFPDLYLNWTNDGRYFLWDKHDPK